jgi:Rrf2 family protein
MDRIINVSDRVNAAIHALALAAGSEGRVTAAAAAGDLGVSPSYFAKVLQILVREGFLVSSRGAAGGFELARKAGDIRCLEVLEAVDGPLPERDCLFAKSVCARKACTLKTACARATKALREALESTSIAAVAASFK